LAIASRSYLDARGMPGSPEAIKEHDCIVLRNSDGLPEVQWPLASGGTLQVRPRMLSAGFRLMIQAVYAGLGIGMLPESALEKNPDLVALFPDEIVREDHLRLAYVERDFQLPHVRAFIERSDRFWKTWLQDW
jgi:DNA-binding transcriptional LysR family regulator